METTLATSVILIGMPGSGKTSVGHRVANMLEVQFIDTDAIIVERCGRDLQQIINEDGHEFFLKMEEKVLCELNPESPAIISTGGSAVLSDKGMQVVKSLGKIIFLDCSEATLSTRIRNFKSRGIILNSRTKSAEEALSLLYQSRHPLYERYADFTVNMDHTTVNEAVNRVLSVIDNLS